MQDPSWQRNCDTLVRALQSLERKTSTIRRSANKLVSVKDIERERERTRKTTADANATEVQSIQDTLRLVEQFIRFNPNLNAEGVKLMNESQSALQSYQQACDGFYKKCISVEESSRGKRGSRSSRAFQEDSDQEGETNRLLGDDAQPQAETVSAKTRFERDLYEDLMKERARETKEIADNVRDINEIFGHINEMVEEQGVQLDVVDGNLSAAERATRNASRSLQQAQQYQESTTRGKLWLIFVVVIFVLASIALIF